jgi:hypothetical protein
VPDDTNGVSDIFVYYTGYTSRFPIEINIPSPPVYSVTVSVLPGMAQLMVGEELAVSVNIENQSVGCQYLTYDLTLNQFGQDAPIFTYLSRQQIGPPVFSPSSFRLLANRPGVVTLSALAYGERNCGNDGWGWVYNEGNSVPVVVLPRPTIDTPTPTPTFTPTPTATPTPTPTAGFGTDPSGKVYLPFVTD